MAHNLVVSELSNLFLGPNDTLNQESMNPKFLALKQNDVVINDLFSNTIGVWECSWYYDSSVKGYSIGDAVWLNTEDPDDFVKSHASLIKHYTDFNSQILNKLPDFDGNDSSVMDAYKTAMSGYTDVNLGKGVVLPPIFDIGDYTKPIQLAISLKNNNKSLLTDDTAWKKLFVNTDEDEDNVRDTIDRKEQTVLKIHLRDYHLENHEDEAQAKLSDYMNEPTSFAYYTTAPASMYKTYEDYSSSAKPLYGIDYVRYSIRKPIVSDSVVSQCQFVRYWKSGMIEHFGTIATDNEMFIDKIDNVLKIPFDWTILDSESGARAYERGILVDASNNVLTAQETTQSNVPPIDNMINVVYEKSDVKVDGKKEARAFAEVSYNLSLHAIYQNQNGIEEDYIPIAYGDTGMTQNWNSNYLTNEVLDRKEKNCFTLKLGTRVLPPYVSYYAVGKGEF